jgi:hypothetical protein
MKYRVDLEYIQYSQATVIIEADSLDKAVELAEELDSDGIYNWEPFDDTVVVHEVIEADPQDIATASIVAIQLTGVDEKWS